MTAAATLARLEEAGVVVAVRPDGKLRLRPSPPAELLAEVRRDRDAIIGLICTGQAEAIDTSPTIRCPICNHNLWWRKSLNPAPANVWQCASCAPPDLSDWIDATAVP